ncbi:MAG: hypothetical protein KJO78_15590 [Alphaproteobacteria bacterium]|nr:hypothetical protein [Alphaproteobacteria bacterium]
MERVTQVPSTGSQPPLTGSDTDEIYAKRQPYTGELHTWADGPLAMVASELSDLTDQDAEDTITSLIELSQSLHRDEVVILNLEDRTAFGPGASVAERINALQALVLRACHNTNSSMPHIVLERRGDYVDLRIKTGLKLPEVA